MTLKPTQTNTAVPPRAAPMAAVWDALLLLTHRILAVEKNKIAMTVGPARPIAEAERDRMAWREITIAGQSFRVATIEDE